MTGPTAPRPLKESRHNGDVETRRLQYASEQSITREREVTCHLLAHEGPGYMICGAMCLAHLHAPVATVRSNVVALSLDD